MQLDPTLQHRLSQIPDSDDFAATVERAPRATLAPHKSASPAELQALRTLGAIQGGTAERFEIHDTLGEGGMGIVHLATQTTMSRHVAVKTLREKGDQQAVIRILREAWVTGALEHPNVVPIYDIGLDPLGMPVIVMKRIEGNQWGELMARPDVIKERFSADDPLEWNLRIFASVCNAVHFAHSRGVLHRDLKPENVMIGAFGEVYVLDWGIAVSLKDDGKLPSAKTATEIAGTPAYMAPEMLLGQPGSLSERTDVYLLGGIFYEIFAGRPPHVGDSMQALMSSVLLSNPPYAEGFPREARRICKQAMARDPQERFATVDELRRAVEDYLKHRGSRRIAYEAKLSLARLEDLLKNEPAGEERTLAMFNLLGECRFGYKAALAAWAENRAARKGLDRALLLVIEEELASGDPATAGALLREVAVVPEGLAARVEKATQERNETERRLQELRDDQDSSIGARTRMAGGIFFGVLWTLTPFARLLGDPFGFSHVNIIIASSAFLLLGAAFRFWARESLSKTLLNRRLSWTLGAHFVAQIVMASGAMLSGMSEPVTNQMLIFGWMLIQGFLAIHVEKWFAVPALACAVVYVVIGKWPELRMWLTSLVNFILMVTIVKVWIPKGDISALRTRVKERRRLLMERSRLSVPHDDDE